MKIKRKDTNVKLSTQSHFYRRDSDTKIDKILLYKQFVTPVRKLNKFPVMELRIIEKPIPEYHLKRIEIKRGDAIE